MTVHNDIINDIIVKRRYLFINIKVDGENIAFFSIRALFG
jgi:hypothetical protein